MERALELLPSIITITISIIVAYFIIRALSKDKASLVNKFFKILVVFFIIVIAWTMLVAVVFMDEPDALEAVINQMKSDPKIESQIGDYNGHSYNTNEVPIDSDSSGSFDLTVTGNKGELKLKCFVEKNDKGDWVLIRAIEQETKEEEEK